MTTTPLPFESFTLKTQATLRSMRDHRAPVVAVQRPRDASEASAQVLRYLVRLGMVERVLPDQPARRVEPKRRRYQLTELGHQVLRDAGA